MLDPLGVVTKTRAAVTEGASGPADAPTTIVHNEELQRQQQENYFYVPDIGNVPEIAVPDFLPNLLGEILGVDGWVGTMAFQQYVCVQNRISVSIMCRMHVVVVFMATAPAADWAQNTTN